MGLFYPVICGDNSKPLQGSLFNQPLQWKVRGFFFRGSHVHLHLEFKLKFLWKPTSHPTSCLQSEATSPRQDQPWFFFGRLAAQDSLLKEIYEVLQLFFSSKSGFWRGFVWNTRSIHCSFRINCQVSVLTSGFWPGETWWTCQMTITQTNK